LDQQETEDIEGKNKVAEHSEKNHAFAPPSGKS
jgi:hypothetical protein